MKYDIVLSYVAFVTGVLGVWGVGSKPRKHQFLSFEYGIH